MGIRWEKTATVTVN